MRLEDTPVIIDRIWQHDDNGNFAGVVLLSEQNKIDTPEGTARMYGRIMFPLAGALTVRVDGELSEDLKGLCIDAEQVRVDIDADRPLWQFYLCEIPGVGPATADKIHAKAAAAGCGAFVDFLTWSKRDETILSTIPKNRREAADPKAVLQNLERVLPVITELCDAQQWIVAHKVAVPISKIQALYDIYNGALSWRDKLDIGFCDWLKACPYRLTRVGVSVKDAERVAIETQARVTLGYGERALAYLREALKAIHSGGHTAFTVSELQGVLNELRRRGVIDPIEGDLITSDICGIGAVGALTRAGVCGTEFGHWIDKDGREICIQSERDAGRARAIVSRLRAMVQDAEPYSPDAMQVMLADGGLRYTDEQLAAINGAIDSGAHVITGGPGTGKTTIVRGVITRLEAAGISYNLCAPTGKAAERLAAATGRTATTIHALIGKEPGVEQCRYNTEEPLETGYTIIDEASMMDEELFGDLLDATPEGAGLLLVGDADQLPSVGPGNVLRDILHCGWIPAARLSRVFRQSNDVLAEDIEKIRTGDPNLVAYGPVKILYEDTTQDVMREVRRLAAKHYKKSDTDAFKIVGPVRNKRYALSVPVINTTVQFDVNPPVPGMEYCTHHGYEFRPGDPVLFTKNNTKADYYNGDIGTVMESEPHKITVMLRGNPRELKGPDLEAVDLAYATTIHKAQGSECNTVVIVLPCDPVLTRMLTRELLYVAVTRAKKRVYIIQQTPHWQWDDQRLPVEIAVTTPAPRRHTILGRLLAGDKIKFERFDGCAPMLQMPITATRNDVHAAYALIRELAFYACHADHTPELRTVVRKILRAKLGTDIADPAGVWTWLLADMSDIWTTDEIGTYMAKIDAIRNRPQQTTLTL